MTEDRMWSVYQLFGVHHHLFQTLTFKISEDTYYLHILCFDYLTVLLVLESCTFFILADSFHLNVLIY